MNDSHRTPRSSGPGAVPYTVFFLPAVFAAAAFALLASSCSAPRVEAPFRFSENGVVRTVFIEGSRERMQSGSPRFTLGQTSGAGSGSASYRTPVFSFDKPVIVSGTESGFFIDYTIDTPGIAVGLALLGTGREQLRSVPLPVQYETSVRYTVRLQKDESIAGFALESSREGAVTIRAAGIEPFRFGFRYAPGEVSVSEGILITTLLSGSDGAISLLFDASAPGGSPFSKTGAFVGLETRETGTARGRGPSAKLSIADAATGKSSEYELSLSPARQTFYFPPAALGFIPGALELSTDGALLELAIGPIPAGHELQAGSAYDPRITPIPADTGTMLSYPKTAWRQSGFELFSWNIFPEVLVFDFADYAIQAKFFGRLGFFVAVTGEAGRIEDWSYYAGRHVYNAHDYRPEDLAAFFELARRDGIALNAQETFLMDLCLERGILRIEGGAVVPGRGAVLSFSEETSPLWLRKRLLTHETAHGLFYASAAYRDACTALWRRLTDHERGFFELFLLNKGRLDGREGYDGYDVTNEYLTVNETQAHIVQLDRGEVSAYFGMYFSRMKAMLPGHESLYRQVERDPGMFDRVRTAFEEAIFDATGIRNGVFYTLTARSGR